MINTDFTPTGARELALQKELLLRMQAVSPRTLDLLKMEISVEGDIVTSLLHLEMAGYCTLMKSTAMNGAVSVRLATITRNGLTALANASLWESRAAGEISTGVLYLLDLAIESEVADPDQRMRFKARVRSLSNDEQAQALMLFVRQNLARSEGAP